MATTSSAAMAVNPVAPPTTLIWHVDSVGERDWIRYLLSGAYDSELTDLEFEVPRSNAIHVVSSNTRPLALLEPYFRACNKVRGSLVLVHLSDEWFSGGYRLYGQFDYVLRVYHTWLAKSPGILTIPLGYPNSTLRSPRPKAASTRQYAWTFDGQIKSSRPEMLVAMQHIGPHIVSDTRSRNPISSVGRSKEAFDRLLSESTFAPCPMGNVGLETWRLYEALEAGAIPLIERRLSMDYYRDLLGANPIPTFGSWDTAARFCTGLLTDPVGLDSLQATIMAWWASKKEAVRATVLEGVRGPHSRLVLRDFAFRPVNRSGAIFELLRLVELIRHQTLRSLLRRLRGPRAIVRRMWRDNLSRTLRRE